MLHLITPPDVIAPEDQETCIEVCAALDEWAAQADDPGALAYLAALNFGRKWWVAVRNLPVDSECRKRLDTAVDRLARMDALHVDEQGRLWCDPALISQNGGKFEHVTDHESGEIHRVLIFPYVDNKTGLYIYPVKREYGK